MAPGPRIESISHAKVGIRPLLAYHSSHVFTHHSNDEASQSAQLHQQHQGNNREEPSKEQSCELGRETRGLGSGSSVQWCGGGPWKWMTAV